MNFWTKVWNFPEHHVALGWWLAAALTFWNVIIGISGRVAGQISVFGRRFQKDQLAKRIRTLEYLHENTNGLVRYLATDFVDVAIESCANCFVFIILLVRIIPVSATAMFAIIAINISISGLGRAWRIRTMLNDLNRYPTSVELLKAKLARLNS